MSTTESQSPSPKPRLHWFLFSPWTLLLLVVVLASSVTMFGAGGIVVFAVVVGLAIYVHQFKSLWSLLKLALILPCLVFLIAVLTSPFIYPQRATNRRINCVNNLKEITLALHTYHDVHRCLPPAYIADKSGKPMHSWRVLILPYLEHADLYEKYNFNEPWDGPNNKKLLTSRPKVYGCPGDPKAQTPGATQTSYIAVVGTNAAWAGAESRKLGSFDFPGGTSKTIMLVEMADSGIPWTEPRDLSLDSLGAAEAQSSALTVSSEHGRREGFFFTYYRCCGANVATADGGMRYLPPGSLSIESLRKMLRVGGFSDEEIDSHVALYDVEPRPNWTNIAAAAMWLLSVGMLLARAVRSRRHREP